MVEAETLRDTLLQVKAKALVDAVADTIAQVEAETLMEKFVDAKGQGSTRCFG